MTAIYSQWFHYANYVICFLALLKTNSDARIKSKLYFYQVSHQYDLKYYKIYSVLAFFILPIDHLISKVDGTTAIS